MTRLRPIDPAETTRKAGELLHAVEAASTPARLEAADRGQAPIDGVTSSAEATPARYPTLHKTVKIAELEIFYREAGLRERPRSCCSTASRVRHTCSGPSSRRCRTSTTR
jgi:hypothetical protein